MLISLLDCSLLSLFILVGFSWLRFGNPCLFMLMPWLIVGCLSGSLLYIYWLLVLWLSMFISFDLLVAFRLFTFIPIGFLLDPRLSLFIVV